MPKTKTRKKKPDDAEIRLTFAATAPASASEQLAAIALSCSALPPVHGGLQELFLDELVGDLDNRATGDISELTESIRALGVLQPVLVRPHPLDAGKYQVVDGRRRFEAAHVAGLTKVPALVRDLSDLQTLELQLVQNLQRRDLHPLEEAAAYRRLIDQHGHTAETLAARIGKSRAYVYARLTLTSLSPPARKLFEAGRLDVSHALVVAAIPATDGGKMQAEAAAEIADGFGGLMSLEEARRYVQQRFMLELSRAPFDRKDAGLVPAAGACGPCPKRTGNAPDLFGHVKGKDLCTDPTCFALKRDASWAVRAAEARTLGREVLEGKKAEKALTYGSGWVDVDEEIHELGDKSPRNLMKGDLPVPVLARGLTGWHELVRKEDLAAAMKRAGIKKAALQKEDEGPSAERKKAREKLAGGRAVVAAVLELAIQAKADALWPLVEAFVWASTPHATFAEVAKRLGLKGAAPDERLQGLIDDAPNAAARAAIEAEIVIELMLTAGLPGGYDQRLVREPLETAATLFGVIPKEAAKAAKAAKAKPAKKEKKPKAGKRGA